MTPKQHEAVNDAHLMWSLQSAAQHLTGAAIYVGMLREDPHWLEQARREIEHARKQIAEFEAELAASIADPEAAMDERATKRRQPVAA